MALMHVNYFAQALGMSMQMDVILPEETHGQVGMEGVASDGKFKTLWLLHGASDDHTTWQRRTSIERYVASRGIAVIMPNGHLSFYTDMARGGAYFTHIADELPRICRRFFPLSEAREDNFIAGLSMGGYGSMKIGLSRPENYAGIACFSAGNFVQGITRFAGAPDSPNYRRLTNVFGDDLGSLMGGEHDLFRLADQLLAKGQPVPRIFHCVGTEDGGLENCRATRDYLAGKTGNPFDYTYREYPGAHEWPFWDAHICEALDFFGLTER